MASLADDASLTSTSTPAPPTNTNAPDVIPSIISDLAELRGPDYAEVTLEARQMLIVQQGPSVEQKLAAIENVLRRATTAALTLSSLQAAALNNSQEPSPFLETPVMESMDGAITFGLGDVRDDVDVVGLCMDRESTAQPPQPPADPLAELVDQEEPLVDTMLPFFGHADKELAHNAAIVYVRRLYRAYEIKALSVDGSLRPDVPDAVPFIRASWDFSALPMSFMAASGRLGDSDLNSASYVDLQELTGGGGNSGVSPRQVEMGMLGPSGGE